MNVLLFSTNGVLYEDGGSSAVLGVYIPSKGRVRTFADIPNPDLNIIKMRYGDVADSIPLWRSEGPFVKVYGDISEEISERRVGVDVFLPQDFLPDDSNVFFMVFGGRYVVFGKKEVNEDQREDWGISLTDCEEIGVADFILSSVSDRMLAGGDDRIFVSTHQSDEVVQELEEVLEPFDVSVVKFTNEKKAIRTASSLYTHRDYGIFMLTGAIVSFFLLAAAIVALALNSYKLDDVKADSAVLNKQLRDMQQNKQLGHVLNPKELLEVMEVPYSQPPSQALDAAARAASALGQVTSVTLKEKDIPQTYRKPAKDKVLVRVLLESDEGLLVDQEGAAKAFVADAPWIRRIERPSAGRGIELEIEVQTDDSK